MTDSKNQQSFDAEDEFRNPSEKIGNIAWLKRLAIVGLLASIAQVTVTGISLSLQAFNITWFFLASGIAVLITSLFALLWSLKASQAYDASSDLYQMKIDEREAKALFILSCLLAFGSVALLCNIHFQKQYPCNYATAHSDDSKVWKGHLSGWDVKGFCNFHRDIFFWFALLHVFYILYFLFAARVSFQVLSFGNQAMSYIVFFGSFLLLVFGCLAWRQAKHDLGYNSKDLASLFPAWDIKALYGLSIAAAVIAFAAFVADHRKWRVGFFALSFILLIFFVFQTTFTGFAYRNTRHIYEEYTGDSCFNHMAYISREQLESAGCPAKYVASDGNCAQVPRWENHADQNGEPSATMPSRPDDDPIYGPTMDYACLNTACCGLQGQVYARDFLALANYSLGTLLSAALIAIGSYYFWYKSWIDSRRDTSKDYWWLGLMIFAIIAFVLIYHFCKLSYVGDWYASSQKTAEIILYE